MDADFEQHYQAAERAYGLGDYSQAQALTTGLWEQLESASNDQDPNVVLGWRAVVSLLLGHIQLHGLDQPDEASNSYQRVLDTEPDATIAALAEQGLERCRSLNSSGEAITTEAITTAANDVPIPDLLKDPFLTTDCDQTKPKRPNQVTAMPWLPSDEEPRPIPIPTPEPTVILEPEITTEPMEQSPSDVVESTPQEPVIRLEPDITTEPTEQPSSDAVDPIPQETAVKDLLERSWLRVQLKTGPESPTDSVEPMGLINRIKGVFARSAGR